MKSHFDPYKILGLPRSASLADIRVAYRKLLKVYHPDVGGAESSAHQTRELIVAFELLSDTSRRAKYDQENPPNRVETAKFSQESRTTPESSRDDTTEVETKLPSWYEAFVKSWAGTVVGILLYLLLAMAVGIGQGLRKILYVVSFILPGGVTLGLAILPDKTLCYMNLVVAIGFYFYLIKMDRRLGSFMSSTIAEIVKAARVDGSLVLWLLLAEALAPLLFLAWRYGLR